MALENGAALQDRSFVIPSAVRNLLFALNYEDISFAAFNSPCGPRFEAAAAFLNKL